MYDGASDNLLAHMQRVHTDDTLDFHSDSDRNTLSCLSWSALNHSATGPRDQEATPEKMHLFDLLNFFFLNELPLLGLKCAPYFVPRHPLRTVPDLY